MIHLFCNEEKVLENYNIVYTSKAIFKAEYKIEWFEDETVLKMIKGIDNVKYIGDGLFKSDIFGKLLPENLSGGVKGLILMLKYKQKDGKKSYIYSSAIFGDNCLKYILEIQSKIDASIIITSDLFDSNLRNASFDFYDEERHKPIKSYSEYLDFVFNQNEINKTTNLF